MSDTKHTPSPWHVGGGDQATIYDKFQQRIANSFEGVLAIQRSDAECRANARLIAAAPELLEAAKLVLAWYAAEDDHTKEPDFYKRIAMCRDAEEAIRAAIAKATGSAS